MDPEGTPTPPSYPEPNSVAMFPYNIHEVVEDQDGAE